MYALLLATLLGVYACGETFKASGGRYFVGDDDSDDLAPSRKDDDDLGIRGYGREASAAERLAVSDLVKRYYVAAAATDGAAACRLIARDVISGRNLTLSIPAPYASVAVAALFRRKTCASVETRLFKLEEARFKATLPRIEVASLRIGRGRGLAIVISKEVPERVVDVLYTSAGWMVNGLLDDELP